MTNYVRSGEEYEMGRFLHLKSEVRNLGLDDPSGAFVRIARCEISG